MEAWTIFIFLFIIVKSDFFVTSLMSTGGTYRLRKGGGGGPGGYRELIKGGGGLSSWEKGLTEGGGGGEGG